MVSTRLMDSSARRTSVAMSASSGCVNTTTSRVAAYDVSHFMRSGDTHSAALTTCGGAGTTP